VRANTTRADRAGTNGEYRIMGHKWFCSAPMCDAFIVLAQSEIRLARGTDRRFDQELEGTENALASIEEPQARRTAERLALLLQASLMIRNSSPDSAADAFCATRLAADAGRCFGTLPRGLPLRAIIERAFPA